MIVNYDCHRHMLPLSVSPSIVQSVVSVNNTNPIVLQRSESEKYPFVGTLVSLEVIIGSEKTHMSPLFCSCFTIWNAKNIERSQEIL